MRHSLQSHIIYLEEKVQSLRDRLTRAHLTTDEMQGLKAQMFHAELALEHYRKAYALELSVSSPDPPSHPEADSRGPGATEKPKFSKKKDGLAGITARTGKKARLSYLPGVATGNRAYWRSR